MFQLWPKRMLIMLEPAGITVIQRGQSAQFIANNTTAETPSQLWQNVVNLLEENSALLQKQQLSVVISNHFVRFNVLDWRDDVVLAKDWQALALAHLRNIYGHVADGWTVNSEQQGFGQPSLLTAIDSALLQQLEVITQQAGAKLESVVPAFNYIANKCKKRIGRNDALLVAEKGRLVLGIKQSGHWQVITVNAPLADNTYSDAESMVRRLLITATSLPKSLYLFGIEKHHLSDFDQALSVFELNDIPVSSFAEEVVKL